MKNDSINMGDIVVTVDGRAIGSIQSIEYTSELEVKNGDNLKFFNREYSGTMKNVEINTEFISTLTPRQYYTVIGKGYNLPRGNRLPKKKRIRKKWMKKYIREFTLENCVIEGVY